MGSITFGRESEHNTLKKYANCIKNSQRTIRDCVAYATIIVIHIHNKNRN